MFGRKDLFNIRIERVDEEEIRLIKKRWDHIAKPLDGLGDFELVTSRIGAILQDESINIDKRALIVMCADNGIVEEGVSQSDSSVTAQVARSMGQKKSSVCAMAGANRVDIFTVDIGIKCQDTIEGVINKKLATGTANFIKEPAMSEEMTLQAIETGINMVKELKAAGYRLIATGEMGIGNTTTASAVAAAMLRIEAEKIAGRGAGLDLEGLSRKIGIIREAIEKYGLYEADTLEILSHVGGLDIAGLTGVFIGCAIERIPVVIDGFISATAALVAEGLCQGCADYCIPSHSGREKGTGMILEKMKLRALIAGDMALGEGTGAIMMISLLDTVLAVYRGANRFDDISVEQYERLI